MQFTDWLRGFIDGAGGQLDREQVKRVQDELAKVKTATTTDLSWLKFVPTTAPIKQDPIWPYIGPTWIGMDHYFDATKITCDGELVRSGTTRLGGLS